MCLGIDKKAERLPLCCARWQQLDFVRLLGVEPPVEVDQALVR
jgi:hypothetical protein